MGRRTGAARLLAPLRLSLRDGSRARSRRGIRRFVEAGATVVIIGQGEPERAAAYAAKFKLPCPVLSDPTRAAYAAFGLVEGTPSQILFDAPDAFLRCDYDAGLGLQDARRALGDPMVDSPWQLPGEFVVDADGIVRLAYRYQHCEDYPNPLVLVAAIREATGDGWQPGRGSWTRAP